MREIVDLEGLDEKFMAKYLKFLQQKVNAKIEEEQIKPERANDPQVRSAEKFAPSPK